MRRLARVSSCSSLVLLLACTPSTFGSGDSSGSNATEDSGDGDGDPAGDGDGDPPGDGDGDTMGDGDGDEPCTQIGCACDGSPESCDPTLTCVAGQCVIASCGNGAIDDGEVCDDGNQIDGDGCDADCSLTEILQISAGDRNTCALIEDGRVRCWGEGSSGVVGLGSTDDVGDDETPAMSMDIPFPEPAEAVDVGENFACAKFIDGAMRCWGLGSSGRLGNVSGDTLGDNEALDMLPGIDLGGVADSFSSGGGHTCARMSDDAVRCWGRNNAGQLGLGNTISVGEANVPSFYSPVEVAASSAVAVGHAHSCAITTNIDLVCWGNNNRGQLGYGNTDVIGNDPDETPNSVGKVEAYPPGLPNGAVLEQASLGREHTCARFSTGEVLCWGRNDHGQLGQGNSDDHGDDVDELPNVLDPIELGGDATAISAGEQFTCALIDDGSVRCWGHNDRSQLGIMGFGELGDDELAAEGGPVPLGDGAVAIQIAAGKQHACALLDSNEIYCWGDNDSGQLGYGHTDRVGDDETPAEEGPVPLFLSR